MKSEFLCVCLCVCVCVCVCVCMCTECVRDLILAHVHEFFNIKVQYSKRWRGTRLRQQQRQKQTKDKRGRESSHARESERGRERATDNFCSVI